MNTNNFVGIGRSEAYAPARDSDGRGHEHLGHQDQLSQRPGPCRPSSGPLGWLEVLLAQTHQDAFAVPFQRRGVHLDVARPLGDRGETHVAACLGGQETAASSSLLSDEVTTNGGLQK